MILIKIKGKLSDAINILMNRFKNVEMLGLDKIYSIYSIIYNRIKIIPPETQFKITKH